MDSVRQALQHNNAEAVRRAATGLLNAGVHRRLVLDLQLSSATPELRHAGVQANQRWLEVVAMLVRDHDVPAREIADYLLLPAPDGQNAPSTSRYLRDPDLGPAFVTLLDTLQEKDSTNDNALAAMRARALSNLVAPTSRAAPAAQAGTKSQTLDSVLREACEATSPVRLAALESSLLRRSVDANMPALITASEAEAVDRMVTITYHREGPDGLRNIPFLQSTPSRVHSLEGQRLDARATYVREIGGLRRVQADELVSTIRCEYEHAVLSQDPALSNLQRGALLRQLSGEAVQGIEEIVHLFDNTAETEDASAAQARAWSGPGSLPAALVDIDGVCWRAKRTGDTALSAMEVTLSRVFQLTGLAAPDARVLDTCDALPGGSQHFASRYDPTFKDLGTFLTTSGDQALAADGDEGRRERYAQLCADHSAAVAACDAVLKRAGLQHFWQLQDPDLVAEHAVADKRRFDALEAMNHLLPVALRSEQARHFIASRWLGNWDHLNARMENFGYVERNGSHVGMTVDFGSCGPLGFPTLDAHRKMLPKQASSDIAMLQRPRSLFPIPDAFSENSGDFDVMRGAPGALQDTLAWPYGFQSDSVAALLRPPGIPDPAIADAMAEMGYRLAMVVAKTLHAVVRTEWQVPAAAAPGQWPDAAQMAATLVQRRQALLARYDPAQIRDWITADPQRAARVQQQMADGIRAALGPGVDAAIIQEHTNALQAAHQALLRGDMDAATRVGRAIPPNGVTARIRTLQRLHDCNRRLVAALDANAVGDIHSISEELLSPAVFGQLLVDLETGSASDELRRASLEANRDWLLLVKCLFESGHVSATQVARSLLEFVDGSAYPPNVGAHAHRDPALGMAFITLLETLVTGSAEMTPAGLREKLLTLKPDGVPNYYAALAASGASKAWDQRLQQAGLLPDSAEYIRSRSLRSWATKRLLFDPRRGDDPIRPPAAAQHVAGLPLSALVQHMDHAYGPRRVIELELAVMRQDIHVKMTRPEEDQAMQKLVEDSVQEAWRDAMQKHRLPPDTPVPAKMIDDLSRGALRDYQDRMRDLRRTDAAALVQAGEQRYRDAVLAEPGMPLPDRRRLLKQCAAEIAVDISAMVRDAGGNGSEAMDTRHFEQGVKQYAAAQAGDMEAHASRQARAQAAAHAATEAGQRARSSAGESARRTAVGAVGSITRAASLAASSRAHAQAQTIARKEAERRASDKAAKEATARATRDAVIRSRQFQNEVETRLAILRSPGVSTSTVRNTDAQIETRLGALRGDNATRQLEQRLRALRQQSPQSEPAPGPRQGRLRTREHVDPRTGAAGSTTR